jgi:hypothetical protein
MLTPRSSTVVGGVTPALRLQPPPRMRSPSFGGILPPPLLRLPMAFMVVGCSVVCYCNGCWCDFLLYTYKYVPVFMGRSNAIHSRLPGDKFIKVHFTLLGVCLCA